MGFEPQTSQQPLDNPGKRTTKVNFAIVIGAVRAVSRHAHGTEVPATTR